MHLTIFLHRSLNVFLQQPILAFYTPCEKYSGILHLSAFVYDVEIVIVIEYSYFQRKYIQSNHLST